MSSLVEKAKAKDAGRAEESALLEKAVDAKATRRDVTERSWSAQAMEDNARAPHTFAGIAHTRKGAQKAQAQDLLAYILQTMQNMSTTSTRCTRHNHT
jgi:hypothetical protein